MRKIITLGIVLLFLGMVISSSTGFNLEKQSTVTTFDGNTFYVGGSGPGNYTKIQDAIDDASNVDTVFVYNDSSPYYENVNVDKSIILISEERDSTVIDGGGIDSVIEVSADFVHIEGFTVTNCMDDLSEAGINIFTDWNTIKNNNIVENQLTGIRLSHSHFNLIENNTLKDNVCYHIFLRGESNYNTLQNNTLTQSEDWLKACDGIWLDKSSNNLIENNEITRLKSGIGISLYETSSHNVVNNNMIHNNPDDDKSIQIADHSDFNLIQDNEIRYNDGAGIMMFFSQGNEIIGNTIEFLPHQGIAFADCRYNNIIKFNNISSTGKGIDIGMYSSKNIVESNNLVNNTYGIYLSGTDLLGFVPNNVIFGNNIVENNYGICIGKSFYYKYSNDSLIYHNNFINNTQSSRDVCNNSWDNGYPSGGNFWDDYTGNDTDGDGIGETPYNISGDNNQDRYPLMEPYGMTRLTFSKISAGLFKFLITIKNIGNKTAFNVQWNITFDGGFILQGRHSSGTLPKPLLPGEEVTVTTTGIILGFGKIMITVAAWADNAPLVSKSTPGFLFLFFIKINPGGGI